MRMRVLTLNQCVVRAIGILDVYLICLNRHIY